MSAPRDFAELFTSSASWLKGEGPHADMVLSTRIRLARNLRDVPFTHRARDEQLHGVLASVASATQASKALAGGLLLKMQECTPIERQVLVERHVDAARPTTTSTARWTTRSRTRSATSRHAPRMRARGFGPRS